MKRKALFLCTGNSCRSQMAEAIVNARMSDEWEAVSAGTKPVGHVHPKALEGAPTRLARRAERGYVARTVECPS